MEKFLALEDFKKKIDKELSAYLDRAIKEAKKNDALMADAVRYGKKIILAGGKRLRPALMYWGYIAVGGKDKERMLKASMSIEMIHDFLLIHDDIIDRDSKRHGMDTINRRYEKIGKKFFGQNNAEHFGNSMALIIGDMASAMGNQIIFDSGFPSNLVIKALSRLQSIVSFTVSGEMQDLYMEYSKKGNEADILKMYENKTAKYTIEGPLQLGAILGGADEKTVESFSRYAIPIGIAFQIQDDILGIFGSGNKMGKEIGSDIKEGKRTILIAKALDSANKQQKKVLESTLGRKKLEIKEIEILRNIIKEIGALDYAKNMAKKLTLTGKKELNNLSIKPEARKFLEDVADYIIGRDI